MPKPLILDLHIPYCIRPVRYLHNFHAVGTNEEKNRYMAALKREVLSYEGELDDYEIRAVRLSGGSASVMSPDLLGDLLATVRRHLPVARGAEVSYDALPVTIGTPSLTGIASGHPNRVELMMCSENDGELRALNCTHTMQQVRSAMLFFAKFHLNNVGLTVYYGIPGQTHASWTNTLRACTIMHPGHIRTLPLDVTDAEGMPSEAQRYEMFCQGADFLQQQGYRMYAAGHFCLPGYEYRFDALSMNGDETVGLGVNGGSYLDGCMVRNTSNLTFYLHYAGDFEKTIAEAVRLDQPTQMLRYAMGRMRMTDGLTEELFEARFGAPVPAELRARLDSAVQAGLAQTADQGWRPTLRGLFQPRGIL